MLSNTATILFKFFIPIAGKIELPVTVAALFASTITVPESFRKLDQSTVHRRRKSIRQLDRSKSPIVAGWITV